MIRPRFARLAAAFIGLLACCGVLPAMSAFAESGVSSSHSAVEKGQIDLSVRYGCSGAGWVEARFRINPGNGNAGDNSNSGDIKPEAVQIGYTTNGSGPDSAYAQGGPIVVAADNDLTLVRLAGPPPNGASVFATRLKTGSTTVVDLPATCSPGSRTDFRMAPAVVTVEPGRCTGAGDGVASVTVDNPNDHRVGGGPKDVDYTVLTVGSGGRLLADPGQMLRFGGAGTLSTDVSVPTDGSAYQIRVIGVDGSVVAKDENAPDCTPSTTSETPSTEPVTSVATSTVPDSTEPVTTEPVTNPTDTSTESSVPGASESTSVSTIVTPPLPPVTATKSKPNPKPSDSQSVVVPVPSASVTPGPTRHSQPPPLLANGPRTEPSISFKLQPSAAMVVIVDALAIGALVVGTMQVARRR